jgi:acyl carrier protein
VVFRRADVAALQSFFSRSLGQGKLTQSKYVRQEECRSNGSNGFGLIQECGEGMAESIQDRVLRVIATTRRVPLDTIRPDSTFEELGIDSLDRLNILFELEGEFDIEIDDEQAKQVTSLQQMIEGITKLVDAKASGSTPA